MKSSRSAFELRPPASRRGGSSFATNGRSVLGACPASSGCRPPSGLTGRCGAGAAESEKPALLARLAPGVRPPIDVLGRCGVGGPEKPSVTARPPLRPFCSPPRPKPGLKPFAPQAADDEGSDEENDGRFTETSWVQRMRREIKNGCAGRGTVAVRVTPRCLAPPPLSCASVPSFTGLPKRTPRVSSPSAQKTTVCCGKAQMAACYEDMISFLEMNSLSGAYALAFASCGVEDISQLLQLDDAGVDRVIEACCMEAMDEILLRGALKESRVN